MRKLLQVAETDLASADQEVSEQPGDLTADLSQSDDTAVSSEDLSGAEASIASSHEQLDVSDDSEQGTATDSLELGADENQATAEESDPSATDSQLPQLDVSSSDQATMHGADSASAAREGVSLAEIESGDDPFIVQSIQSEDQDAITSSQASQVVNEDTLSKAGASTDAQSTADPLSEVSKDADLTFDQALAQAIAGDELSDETGNTTSTDSTGDLTFAEAVAATKGTESVPDVIANSTQASASDTVDTPILDSALPSVENINSSLTAVMSQPDTSAANVHSTTGLLSGLAGSAANIVSDAQSKVANASQSVLSQVCWGVMTLTHAEDSWERYLSSFMGNCATCFYNPSGCMQRSLHAGVRCYPYV